MSGQISVRLQCGATEWSGKSPEMVLEDLGLSPGSAVSDKSQSLSFLIYKSGVLTPVLPSTKVCGNPMRTRM